MNRQELVERLLSMPEALFNAEAALLNAEQVHRQAREALADREASLLIGGECDAKNETLRQAILREKTESLRADVEGTRTTVEYLRLAAERARAEFAAYRATSRLVAGEEMEAGEVMREIAKLTGMQARANAEIAQEVARLSVTVETHGEQLCRLLARAEAEEGR